MNTLRNHRSREELRRRRTLRNAVIALFAVVAVTVGVVTAVGTTPVAHAANGAEGTVAAKSMSSAVQHTTLQHAAATPSDATGALSTVLTAQGTDGYTAAGIGMRNLGYGTIDITGIPKGATVKSATLMWDILADSSAASFAQGTFADTAINGTAWASGASPCWPVASNFSYEADVTALVHGNGDYQLSGFTTGESDGADPWNVGSTSPLLEGASLIVIYQETSLPPSNIQIAEGATETDSGNSAQATLDGFRASSTPAATTTYIVADGQEQGNTASFDGTVLPGVGFPGADPQAVPNYSLGNLWDTVTANVSTYVQSGDTSADLAVTGNDDCLVWVGQVLSVQQPAVGIYSDFKSEGQTTRALNQGWTLIGNVAGLSNPNRVPDEGYSSCAAPWTGSTGSDDAVEHDLSAYESSHPGTTVEWESFWTAAVPPVGVDLQTAGEQAGKQAADEIENAYESGGVRPQYIVLDFEPSPQVVSCGRPVSPLAKRARVGDKQCWDKTADAHNCWQVSPAGIEAFALGWQAGILTAVEDQPSAAAIYANSTEYNHDTMWSFGLPVIVAAAGKNNTFPTVQPALENTSAVLGYAAYYASCGNSAGGEPLADSQIALVDSWGGSLNTVQFLNSRICPP